uniref:Condensin complex subunit 2 n=1 Tax=Caenorhabditis tropicalis TaxID=1561998 RepID=A0A1I7TX56_9PELO
MDIPSSSNVTGRRKRNVVQDDDDDDSDAYRSTPLRKVRGTKKLGENDIAPTGILKVINSHVDDIINKKKVGTLNCFEFKSPLEMYGIEAMIEANASIHDMAVVLESAQHILSYRVDRLLSDVRQVDSALSSGDVTRGDPGKDNIHISVESRKLKKKMAVADGMTGLAEFFDQIDDEDLQNREEGENVDEDEDMIAGEKRNIDQSENSKDVDVFIKNHAEEYSELIFNLSIHRSNTFKSSLTENVSCCVSAEDTAHDIKDSNIDWLRSNPTFQKATKGSLDNTANSFHSLNYYGVHSTTGRALVLHPRIVDDNADARFFESDVTVSLAKNTQGLIENALEKKPTVLDNYLMLEVKDRPVVGRYKIMSKDSKKSTLPLAEAARERDLANLTFAEMNQRPSNADATMAGNSDMSMMSNQGLPLNRAALDQTIVLGRTTSVVNQRINDEYVPPGIEALALEESLIGKIPLEPIDTSKLSAMFDEKMEAWTSANNTDSKIWKNGMRAEEWGENDEQDMKTDSRYAVVSGIEGWIKATDSWTNSDVVKMIVNRDTRLNGDDAGAEEHENRTIAPEQGKSFFLMRSNEFMNNYPTDRMQETKIAEEDRDIMLMLHDEEGNEKTQTEQIRREISEQNHNDDEMQQMEEMDYEMAGGYEDMDFGGNLAAPVEADELAPATARNNESADRGILFNDQIDEVTTEVRDELAIEKEIEKIALGPDEVAELMTSAPPKQLVKPTAEMRDEIRNMGKTDNAHWVPPEIADREKEEAELAQRKRRAKKAKSKKASVEDFVHYFREIPDEELEREITRTKSSKIADERSTFLTEQQLYLPTLGVENKPHVAFEMGLLGNSGLFYKKSYGKIRLERTKAQKDSENVFASDLKKNSNSDCLNWLMSFSGFKCMENRETVEDAHETTQEPIPQPEPYDDYVNDIFEDDRYDPRHDQELAAAQMGPDMQKKFALAASHINQLMPTFHFSRYHGGEYEDSDDEFEDSFDRHSIQAKNLDAAKHKRCIADILKNDTLSMPSIQYALEQLTLNQTIRQNNTTIRDDPSTSEGNETSRPLTPQFDADKTLTAVFEYHSPSKSIHNVNEIMRALTETPNYQEEEKRTDNKPTSSKYGTANTENRKVKIKGCHTLLSLALSMPSKMGEVVRPSSIVSFLLHIANENGLQIVQDRSKRTWMSDFLVLNRSESLPRGVVMGNIEETDDFWKRTQDPDAIEGTSSSTVFSQLVRPKTQARKGRGAQRQQSEDLDAIVEEDVEDVEEEEEEEAAAMEE